MSANEFLSLLFLQVFGFFVTMEVYAALKAFDYTRRLDGGSPRRRRSIAWSRYQWSSIVFHEAYCRSMKVDPAYRLEFIAGVWALAMAAWGVGEILGMNQFSYLEMLNMQTATAAGFFIAAYGRSFLAHSREIAMHQDNRTWNCMA
jgi:hypothetical protein